jgi:tetratricopeptide (TPR) repeat protein
VGALVALAALAGVAAAQGFDENVYYQQCLRFEAGGDLETARRACQNALQVRPSFAEAELALARIELRLGDAAGAESRLRRIRDRIGGAEPLVLLAEAVLAGGRPLEAESFLQSARTVLAERGNRELEARLHLVAGEIAQHRGEYDAALAAYGSAIAADGINVEYRLADATLRLRLGDAASAEQQLRSYMQLTGDSRDPRVRSLLGRSTWAQGDLAAAAGELATAHQLRGSRDVEAQARDLRSLALIYTAQGDYEAGSLAMRESLRRDNLLSHLNGNTILWLFALLLLVGAHLVGESRISNSSSLEVVDGPRTWSVGNAYGVLVLSLLLAVTVAVLYGVARFDNPLVLFTPVQSTDALALFFITLSVMLALLSWHRVQSNGFDPMDTLIGTSSKPMLGIGWGVLMLGALVAYLYYLPFDGVLGGFYLNVLQLTPYVVAAMILIPLSELFFRAMLVPTLARRYDGRIAMVVSATLYAIVFGTPVAVLLVFGLILADLTRRHKNGIEPLLAQLTLHIGLVVAVAVSPFVRSLFF